MRTLCAAIALTMSILLTACGDAGDLTAPESLIRFKSAGPSAPQSSVNILKQGPTAPPLDIVGTEVQVPVVKGERQTIRIRYTAGTLPDSLVGYLKLDFHQESLGYWPDGSQIADGEVVTITISIDPNNFTWHFAPSGLMFDRPVELRVRYHAADPDFNEDGAVDAADEQIRTQLLGLWRQEDDMWVPVEANHGMLSRKFDAELEHFSNYAVGW